MHLSWYICNRDGKEWGMLQDREGGEVRVGLNGQRTAVVSASLEERVTNWIHPGKSRVKVYCHPLDADPARFLLFNGLILQPRGLGRRIEIPAVCPSVRLLNASATPLPEGDPAPDLWEPVNLEQSALLWHLIDLSDKRARELQAVADPGHVVPTLGIIQGSLANSNVTRSTRIADGKTTWDALLAVSARDGSPDFELEPLDREDGVHAKLNTYHPRQGFNRRESAILEYGHNLSDIAYEPSGVDLCNRYVLVGKGQGKRPVYVAENRESIGRFGVWQKIESAPDVGDVEVLQRMAEEHVALHSFQVNFVDVTPTTEIGGQARGWARDAQGAYVERREEYAVPPRYGPPGTGQGFDYWLGDTITVRAKDQFSFNVDKDQPGPDTDIYARVTDTTFNEVDAAGNVVVSHDMNPVVPHAHVGGYESQIRGGGF